MLAVDNWLDKAILWLWRAGGNGGFYLVLLVSVALLTLFLFALPWGAGVDTTPLSDDKEVEIVASTGEEGFPVEAFCNDPLTAVRELPAPDASGVTYQLIRVRGGVTETVVYTSGPEDDNRPATHYFDEGGEQKSEPAFVTKNARECLDRKAR